MDAKAQNLPKPHLLERSIDNASRVIQLLLPVRPPAPIHAGKADVAIAAIIFLLAVSLAALSRNPGVSSVPIVLQSSGILVIQVLCLLITLHLVRKGAVAAQVIVAAIWALSLGQLVSFAIGRFTSAEYKPLQLLTDFGPGIIFFTLVLLAMLGPIRGLVSAVATLATGAALSFAVALATMGPIPAPPPQPLDAESIFPAQSRLLAQQSANLRRGDPNRVELFALLGAGDPYADVFRREVVAVADQLVVDFDARDRIVTLANSASDPLAHALLNKTNLDAALAALSAAMDSDDVLLLFLTSHGAPGYISTSAPGLGTHNLTPGDIAASLEANGIGHSILVISACYSGSFVDRLAAPNRLILTAAAADRSSFGCNPTNDWTDWGRAFFADGLRKSRDVRLAAVEAQAIVAKQEQEAGLVSSLPQIVAGSAIDRAIDQLLSDLPPD